MAAVISLANMKGGVGKTQSAYSLGYTLATDQGQRVLMVDMDPQSSLSESAGVRLRKSDKGIQDVLDSEGSVQVLRVVRKLGDNLWLAPASILLAQTELNISARILARETALKQALAPVHGDFDIIIIDTAPSLALLTVNSLVASNFCIVPVKPAIVDMMGLRAFLGKTLKQVQASNEGLQWRVLVTFWHPTFKANQRALAALNRLDVPMFTTRIGESVRVSESAEFGRPVVAHDPSNPRAAEYRALAGEVLEWINHS